MSAKGCEACGGHVRPIDSQSVFGYCENCGIVYVLKDRMKGAWDAEIPGRLEVGIAGESKGTNNAGVSVVDSTSPPRPSGSHWRCPDCDTEIHSDNDSDLEFSKREHIREYHPNRATG